MPPSAARVAAADATLRKDAASGIRWSDGATSARLPGARCSSHKLAASTAGAVLRAAGSMITAAGVMPMAANWSRTTKRNSAEVTITGGANPSPDRRRAVAWNRLSSPTSLENCLGKPWRDTGHSRVPEPPQRITGWTRPPVSIMPTKNNSTCQCRYGSEFHFTPDRRAMITGQGDTQEECSKFRSSHPISSLWIDRSALFRTVAAMT